MTAIVIFYIPAALFIMSLGTAAVLGALVVQEDRIVLQWLRIRFLALVVATVLATVISIGCYVRMIGI